MCLHLLAIANTLNDKYIPKDIFISYSQDNLTINQGSLMVKLPKVKIESKEKDGLQLLLLFQLMKLQWKI